MKEPRNLTQLSEPFSALRCFPGRTDPSPAQKTASVDVAGVQAVFAHSGHRFVRRCVCGRGRAGRRAAERQSGSAGPPLLGGGGEATARQES